MSATKLKLVRVTDHTEIPLIGDLLVGRLEESGLRITQGMPSRRHAQISLVGGEVWVEDLGSANGTFINGTRISAKTKLNSRDRLRFDVEEFDYHAEPEADDASGDDKTKYRKPELQPLPAQPEPLQAVVAVEASGIIKRPGAWADPDSDDGGAHKTKFMDPAALKAMLDHAPTPDAARAAKVDAPHLLVVAGSATGTMIKLQVGTATAEWTIGSGPEREVVFVDSGVSALHAKIVNDGARWKLLDQMSANGTFVNGKRSNVSFLSADDRIRFGPVECEFKLPASPAHASSRRTEVETPGSSGSSRRSTMAWIALGAALSAALLAWRMMR